MINQRFSSFSAWASAALSALVLFVLSLNQSAAIEIVSSSLPSDTVLEIDTGSVNFNVEVRGTPDDTPAPQTYPFQVYVTGNDIYGNAVFISVAQGSVTVRGQIANPGGTPEAPTTDRIIGTWTVPNDGTLFNVTNGYRLRVEIYQPGTPLPTTRALLGVNLAVPQQVSGALTINVIPDIAIPEVRPIVKTPATVLAATLTGVGIDQILLTNPGSGYDPTFPPAVTITPSGGAVVRAVVEQSTGSINGFEIVNPGTFGVAPTVTIAPPPTYMTQRTGGLLYKSGSYYGGDIIRFRTTVQNTVGGVGGRQGRPLRPADRHRLQTVLTTDPVYTAQSGADDFNISFIDISGDQALSVGEGSATRAIQVFGTPNGFTQVVPPVNANGGTVPATYGLPHAGTDTPATATATLDGDRVDSAGFIIANPGGAIYDDDFPPAVTIAGGGGTGATATATVVGGSVAAIALVNQGAGYTAAPTVTIAPPRVGARYYQPLPDDGFLDLGERIDLDYEVLLPKNYSGIYFAAARANTLGSVQEADAGREEASRNNTVVANTTQIRLLSGPQETTQLLSGVISSNGTLQTLSNGPSEMTAIDGAGRFVAYQSTATNLTGNSTTSNSTQAGAIQQILRREVATGQTIVASISSGGALGNGISQNPSINRSPQNLTEDGRFVAFESQANNLVENDINAASDIFVRSYGSVLRTNRISVNQNGEQGNSGSFNPSISGNGRFVAFESEATNLDLVNPLSRGTTATATVTVTPGGVISGVAVTNGGSLYDPFNPPQVNFVSPTGTGAQAKAVVNRNGIITAIDVTNGGSGYNLQGSSTDVYVASPLPLQPTGSQIYVHDRDVSGSGVFDAIGNTRTYLVSITNNNSSRATATATVTTNGSISSITPTSGGQDYVTQYPPAVVIEAPQNPAGTQATAEAYVNSNGIVDAIRITNPGSGYSPAPAPAPAVTIAPRARPAGDTLNRPGVYGWNNQPRISDDGSVVTWVSFSSNLQINAGDQAQIGNRGWSGVLYRVRLLTGIPLTDTLEAVSLNGDGITPKVAADLANQQPLEPAINGDGSVIAFTSWANNLGTQPDTNGVADVFVRDYNLPAATNRTRRVSESLDRLPTGSISFFRTPLAGQIPRNNPLNLETVTLDDGVNLPLVFTFTLASPVAATDVEIGATASVTRDNLLRAINNEFRNGNTSIVAGNLPTDLLGGVNTASNQSILDVRDLLEFTEPSPNTPATANFFAATPTVPGPALIPAILLVNTNPGALGNQDITTTSTVLAVAGMRNGGRQADSDSGEFQGVLGGSNQPALDISGYTVAYRSTMQTLDVFDRTFTGTNGLLQGEVLRMLQNASSNVYVADRDLDPGSPTFGDTEKSVRASVNKFGYMTNRLLNTFSSADSHKPALSANGRFVTFSSDSENAGGLVFGPTNFDPLDTNGFRDVFLHDRLIATELPPVVVNNRPQVILTEPSWLSGERIGVGSTIYLNALVTDLDEQLGLQNVTFLVNGIPIPATRQYGNYFSAEYLVVDALASNNIVARVIDNSGADNDTAISPAITFQSGGTIPRPISVVLSEPDLGGQTPVVGQAITLNASVTIPFISTTSSSIQGIVRFYANGVLIGERTVTSGANNSNVSLEWIPQTAGEEIYLSAVGATFLQGNTFLINDWATLNSNVLPPITVVGLPDAAPLGSPERIAQELFQIVMSRSPSATELAYYTAQLTNGAFTPDAMVSALINLPEYTQFQNRLFDFHYRLGTAPANYNYLSNLSLMKGNTAPLPAAAVDATVTNPPSPFGSTQGQAAAAQSIILSPAFSANFSGVSSFSNQSFWNWYVERMKLFGGIATVYGGNGSTIITGVMNSNETAPLGAGVAFTTAFYAAKDPLRYGMNLTTGLNSPYQFQLKATALQWLFTGNWTAPTTLTVTTQAQLNSLVSNLVDNAIGQPTWSWVLANSLTGNNSTATATNGTGQSNLMRYAFNGNGTQALPTMTVNGIAGLPLSGTIHENGITYLTLTFVRRKNSPSVQYIPEFAWLLGGRFVPAIPSNSSVSITPIDGIWERVSVTDTAPTDTGAPALSRFGRVRVIASYWTPANP